MSRYNNQTDLKDAQIKELTISVISNSYIHVDECRKVEYSLTAVNTDYNVFVEVPNAIEFKTTGVSAGTANQFTVSAENARSIDLTGVTTDSLSILTSTTNIIIPTSINGGNYNYTNLVSNSVQIPTGALVVTIVGTHISTLIYSNLATVQAYTQTNSGLSTAGVDSLLTEFASWGQPVFVDLRGNAEPTYDIPATPAYTQLDINNVWSWSWPAYIKPNGCMDYVWFYNTDTFEGSDPSLGGYGYQINVNNGMSSADVANLFNYISPTEFSMSISGSQIEFTKSVAGFTDSPASTNIGTIVTEHAGANAQSSIINSITDNSGSVLVGPF